MKLQNRIDLVLHLAHRWMTPAQIAGALFAMFAERPDDRQLNDALAAQTSWSQNGNHYCTHPERRADWLVLEMGL